MRIMLEDIKERSLRYTNPPNWIRNFESGIVIHERIFTAKIVNDDGVTVGRITDLPLVICVDVATELFNFNMRFPGTDDLCIENEIYLRRFINLYQNEVNTLLKMQFIIYNGISKSEWGWVEDRVDAFIRGSNLLLHKLSDLFIDYINYNAATKPDALQCTISLKRPNGYVVHTPITVE